MVEVTEHCAGIFEESATSVRQLNTPRLAFKELHTHFPFDRLDLSGKRWLLHAEALSGACDVPFLRDCDEIPEVAQFQCHTKRVSILLRPCHRSTLLLVLSVAQHCIAANCH